ncbi:hypothetical protein, variant 2 [Aphanomyces astaci]|uniref:C2 domain-containing protein n=1 Tax=Aphanomyces astaci TaxID=112090 RepID=W4GQJ3_APHAT|nr:hypothetical protein, variant 2 [Aphanomyces astaci]ETV81977.1 hypothetical protein, variant 2 [Aphanomyces astaci]|eukprot:XP_009828714.1 hypothetical protein, variant 2 [Aphanomyces astaci]
MASFQVQFTVGGLSAKADAFVVVYLNGAPFGRTETIRNLANPSFLQSFKLDAPVDGEMLKIEVYDEEKATSKNLKDQQLLGVVEVSVRQLVENLAQLTTLRTTGGDARGLFKKEKPPLNVYVQTEIINPTSDVLAMQWSAKDLTNLDGLFNKSDPVLFVSRMVQDGSYLPAFRTEVVDGNLNPVWEKLNVTLQRLANGDLDRPLLAQVFDMDNGEKKRQLIGQVQTTARALLDLPTLYLQSAAGKPAGSLRPLHMRLQQSPPFVGFAPGACQIQAIQGLVAPPPPPLQDKLSQGYEYASPVPTIADKLSQGVAAPSVLPVATVVPELAPLAVPVPSTGEVVSSPVATQGLLPSWHPESTGWKRSTRQMAATTRRWCLSTALLAPSMRCGSHTKAKRHGTSASSPATGTSSRPSPVTRGSSRLPTRASPWRTSWRPRPRRSWTCTASTNS